MKFTVVTPSLGQLDWLRLCVASVRDQADAGAGVEVEHIVQDAGSAGVEEFARAEGAEFGRGGGPAEGLPPPPPRTGYRLRVIAEADGGMYDAIDRGLAKASGDVCAYLNCDEQYLEGALARVAAAFQRAPETEVLFGDMLLVDGGGAALSYRRTVLPDAAHIRLNQLNTPSCATFFRRSVFARGHRLSAGWRTIGDAVWVEGMLRAGVRMGLLRQAVAAFALTGENLGSQGVAREEMARWRAEAGAPAGWMRYPSALAFWVRKALGGAYRRRDVRYALYTRASPRKRVAFEVRGVGFGWPRGIG